VNNLSSPNQSPLAQAIKAQLRLTYNAAADHFDDPPLTLWDHCGRRTVELANVGPRQRVLDVCCGSGASAIPAAERVGPAGYVLGIDLAERLLERARAKVALKQLTNIEFRVGDMTRLDVESASFDVVGCVFGLSFATDMATTLRALREAARPGGTLAITTYGPRLFEPANTIYWEAVGAERPDLRPAHFGHHAIAEPSLLRQLFRDADVTEPAIEPETLEQSISPEEFWAIALGSGHRMPLDLMGPAAAERVRSAVLGRLARDTVTTIATDVLYARAVK
jgi:ubiquinone/menaquinone biosynthesis C-methylase UbiE